jgi:hypothetical protein
MEYQLLEAVFTPTSLVTEWRKEKRSPNGFYRCKKRIQHDYTGRFVVRVKKNDGINVI